MQREILNAENKKNNVAKLCNPIDLWLSHALKRDEPIQSPFRQ